ncbi:DUF1446 domain-containing protein [Nocardioides currus]|uniref:DUF1446 domain-containing protein n=1 Tax=Nocardioides currus TaxID=2133958 RepID=A0A2R7Z3G6_9ACTN|nr:DUF1446 domain-containing protein [Nocardioides currus]
MRIGQFSAYYGDRPDAMAELIADGVDVLTGDYLAELTMLVLKKNQMRGGVGYASGFVDQLVGNLDDIARLGIKVVTNAGGLDSLACAAEVERACRERGLDLTVAAITGDDIIGDVDRLLEEGQTFGHLTTGKPLELDDRTVLTANAYLGAWPIVEALESGADIVICPRVTDASLVIAPAAWHHGWSPSDYDQIAGALWAGHAIECGGQVTGGNFSLFHRHGDLGLPGVPIAEVASNGDSVITKTAGSGGLVDVDTVTAQLLYEVGGPRYDNPDVVGDLSSVLVSQDGPDRVLLSGARGYAPTAATKLSLCFEGGYRNSATVGITGGHVEAKVAWLQREVAKAVGSPESFDQFRWSIIGPADSSTGSFEDATAWVIATARDRRRERVSRAAFSDRITQLGVSSIPGFYTATPPQRERLVGIQWPCLVDKESVTARVHVAGAEHMVEWGPVATNDSFTPAHDSQAPHVEVEDADVVESELGAVIGTRSGDKGGMANVGAWVHTDEQYRWLAGFLTVERIKELLPETAGLDVERHLLPNLRGMNFLLHDYLEMGVASCTRVDAQAKGVGEYLGSRVVSMPRGVLAGR